MLKEFQGTMNVNKPFFAFQFCTTLGATTLSHLHILRKVNTRFELAIIDAVVQI